MCHEPDARAPLPPISGASDLARSAEIVLRSSDGTEFAAFEALTSHDGAPGIVILPDVRGLHPFYRDLAMRSAEARMHAVTIDYFGRTAGLGERNEDFDHMAHVRQTTPDGVARDVSVAMERLRSETAATRLYTMGFCFGGRKSFNQAARQEGLDGVIGFYGLPQRRGEDDVDPPVELAREYRCKVLGLFGGADQAISAGAVDAFRTALDAAQVSNELVTYQGAPHSFFDKRYEEHRDACSDAWRRILGFVGLIENV
jgi:carboxymethylenebutenolidase